MNTEKLKKHSTLVLTILFLSNAHSQSLFVQSPTQKTHDRNPAYDAKRLAEESRKKGIPRPVSTEFNLVDIESRGPRLIITYQFAQEFTRRISDSDKREIVNEVERNFRNSAFCNSPEMRSMLAGGLAITQIYNPFGSSENVATVHLSIRNCPRL